MKRLIIIAAVAACGQAEPPLPDAGLVAIAPVTSPRPHRRPEWLDCPDHPWRQYRPEIGVEAYCAQSRSEARTGAVASGGTHPSGEKPDGPQERERGRERGHEARERGETAEEDGK